MTSQKISSFRKYMGQVLSLNRDLKLIFLTHMTWDIGQGLYSFIFPLYILQLGGNPADIGLISSVMYMVVTFSMVLGGFLADRFDRKKLILQVWICATPAMLIYSFAVQWWQLIPGIVMYSLIIGAPAENAYIASSASEEKIARAFTVTEIGYSFGMIFSPLLGSFLFVFLGIRWLLRISFLISIVSTLTLFFISSQIPKKKEKASKPLEDFLSPLKNKNFIMLMPVFILAAFSITMISPFVSPILQGMYKLNTALILAMGSVLSVGEVAFGVFSGWFGDHWSITNAFSLTLIVASSSALLLAFPSLFFIIPFAIFLMGASRSTLALARSIVGKCSIVSLGAMFAIYSVIIGLFQTLAPEVGSILYESSPILLLSFSAILNLVTILLISIVGKKVGVLHKTRRAPACR